MPQVIGRVITGTYETVRGPDVLHRIAVQREWLLRGEVVTFELPRNLTCAACEGGGCDRCGRSGAIALRERGEPGEAVVLTLPKRTPRELEEQPSVILRVPGQGGWDREHPDEARGHLLLKVVAAAKSDPSVQLVRAKRRSRRTSSFAAPNAAPEAAAAPSSVRRLVPALLVLLWIAVLVAVSLSRTR